MNSLILELLNSFYLLLTKLLKIIYKVIQNGLDWASRVINKLLWFLYKLLCRLFNITDGEISQIKVDYRYSHISKLYERQLADIEKLSKERDELLRFKNGNLGIYVLNKLHSLDDFVDEFSSQELERYSYVLCGGIDESYASSKYSFIYDKIIADYMTHRANYDKYTAQDGFNTLLELGSWEYTSVLMSGFLYLPQNIQERVTNTVFFDFGGFNGAGALIFAEVASHVFTFEPGSHFSVLQNNLKISNVSNITGVNLGVGSESGSFKLAEPIGMNIGSKVVEEIPDSMYNREVEITQIEVTTIDEFVKDNLKDKDKLGVMKFDIEGSEYGAIQGGLETIKRFRPVLLISIYHNAKDLLEIRDVIKELNVGYKFMLRGFSPYVLAPDEYVLICYVD